MTFMARPRAFDIDLVLQQAMRVFWRRGYIGTSMSDIYDATGLKPGSLYAAFKDKDALFRCAFERYAEHFRATLPRDLFGLAAIEAWLELQARLAIEDVSRAGCLIVNTVTEGEAHSPATRALARGRMQEIRDYFIRHLTLAARTGDLPNDFEVDVHADALLGTVVSIMMLGRAGADRSTIQNVTKIALTTLHPKAIS